MCLNYFPSEIELFKKTGKIPGVKIRTAKNGQKFFYGYKAINFDNTAILYTHTYKVGVNKSNRKTKDILKSEKEIEAISRGIHVFFEKEEAKIRYHSSYRKIISCRCYLQHLVAFNRDEAVLTHIEVTSLKDVLTESEKRLEYYYW